ncbi:MAG TPA: MerR family transcriptional regulator [Acidimicrobiales bacterium]|nr:MerR family transcriptional regulator [Acidimicrobiales bacterium]
MTERSHLSIGEVLSLLREEFPDVTISKIRFLESQGLVDPERTPSGYRKFYEHDVERLRWILRQQREHFLPLKVIRGRLTEHSDDEDDEIGEETAVVPAGRATEPRVKAAERAVPARPLPTTPSLFAGLRSQAPDAEAASGRPPGAPGRPEPATATPATATPAPAPAPAAPATATPPAAEAEARPVPAPPIAAARPRPPVRASDDEAESYTVEELAAAIGTEAAVVHELKQYGLISPHAVVGGTPYYDESALAVARAAAEFSGHGVEARHLRMWKNAADREADLFQQVVLPLLRQRNPQARRQALETLAELSAAGAAMRAALVERAIRDIR